METLKELLTIGKHHFDNKQYDDAEEYLKRVLEQNTRYADVLNMLGVISHSKGRFASAMDYFRQALDINPNYTEATLNLAVLYNDLGQYSDAKKLYGRLRTKTDVGDTKIEPVLRGKLSNLHADIGDIYRSIGLYGYSVEEYQKALKLNPNYFDIRTKLGQVLREHGKLTDSMKELKGVLKAKATYSPALVQLGITYYAMDKILDAKKSWQRALEKDPNNDYARMYLRLCDATEGIAKKPKAAKSKTKPKAKTKAKTKAKAKTKKAKKPAGRAKKKR